MLFADLSLQIRSLSWTCAAELGALCATNKQLCAAIASSEADELLWQPILDNCGHAM